MRLHSERVSNMEELSTELMRFGMNEPQLVDAITGMGACVENCTAWVFENPGKEGVGGGVGRRGGLGGGGGVRGEEKGEFGRGEGGLGVGEGGRRGSLGEGRGG